MYQVLVWRVLQPYLLAWLLMGLAIVNLWRKRQETRKRLLLVTIPFLIVTVISLPVVGDVITLAQERPFPPLTQRPADTQAIVVLASYVYRPAADGDIAELDESTCSRCRKAAALYHQGKPCPIIVSGGDTSPGGVNCAAVMADFLVKLGVRAEDVVVEGNSLTTYENAVESCKLLKERQVSRIILVTDVAHLARASGCFRKQGMDVMPCGCHYRAHEFEFGFSEFLPQPNVAQNCQRACHEWLGLAWYWLKGRI
jgi:uncharacterized SAM-binding protein YcdF (DUF218 family)